MDELKYIQDKEYIVRESLANFEINQKVRRRHEDKIWIVAMIKGGMIKMFDGVIAESAHYSELETLNVPISAPEHARKLWSHDDIDELIKLMHLPKKIIADVMGRSEDSIKTKLAFIRKKIKK